ncbi:MAG: Rpn family recombination-promoting nuclease/putative transposase [Cyanobacterium sp. T60_A2020_053]|nr:Rpn family recombination-promoting nuclease/putative transposase [Cyanobacterium sp. T60_A2020_053]
MKTDSIFYKLFQYLPETLFSLLNLPSELAQEYQFLSQELKQLSKRIDGVFLTDNIHQPIYFVEVQFQNDQNLYQRLFTEIFMYLGQYQPPNDFRALVLWANQKLDYPLPKYYESFRQLGKLEIVYLDKLEPEPTDNIGLEIVKLIVAEQEKAKTQVKYLFELTENNIDNTTKRKNTIELVEKILIYKFKQYSREELDKMFTLTDFKKTRFYQETFADGEKQGAMKGKLEGKMETIPELLKLGLSREQVASALHLSIDIVNQFPTPKE